MSAGRARCRALAAAATSVVAVGMLCSGGAPAAAVPLPPPAAVALSTTAAPAPPPAPHVAPPTRPAPLSPSEPVRLLIPSIAVDSGVLPLGLDADGAMEAPKAGFPAGWYTGSPMPGELGPAVLAGHVDWNGPAVFFRLRELAAGDEVVVERKDGVVATFRVSSVQQFGKDAFPTDLVYGDLDHAGLRLVTCGGPFDTTAGSYTDNLVVFAELLRTDGAAPTTADPERLPAA